MGVMRVSRRDMKRGNILDPGWYDGEIVDIKEETNKKKDGLNTVVDFEVKSDNKRVNGTPLRLTISDKFVSAGVPLMEALDPSALDDDEGGTFDWDRDKWKGEMVKIYVKTGEYNNRPQNEIHDFAPRNAEV